jgi:peptidoglycan/xylan/chitin deacetylase (PgdA/CDA1 family)
VDLAPQPERTVKTRRSLLTAASAFALAGCSRAAPYAPPLPPGTTETAPPHRPVPLFLHKVTDIPVIAWHQVIGGVATTPEENQIWNYNKDCAATVPVCDAYDNPETVSRSQLDDAFRWLGAQGYASITADQYLAWVGGATVALPEKPILLTTDDGTVNECAGVTPLLQKHGFNMVMFIVTQFADGATANKEPYAGWNLSWAQLHELPAQQWSYGFHAGAVGHDPAFPDNPGCSYYYPAQLPTESASAYRSRVATEITQGRAALARQLGTRATNAMWAVPWNDLAQPGQPTSGATPAAWLPGWASSQFPVVFLQDPHRNGVNHERYRLEAQGTWSLADFQYNFLGNVRNGFFSLGV